jgi:hypothetical protein
MNLTFPEKRKSFPRIKSLPADCSLFQQKAGSLKSIHKHIQALQSTPLKLIITNQFISRGFRLGFLAIHGNIISTYLREV